MKMYLKKKMAIFLNNNLSNLFFKNSNKIYVLNYHKTYQKNINNFKKQIKFYKEKFSIIDENFLIKKIYLKKKLKSNKPLLLITIDDGHYSNLLAAKILRKENISATFFIPYEYINRKTEKNLGEENKISQKKYSIFCDLEEEIRCNYKRSSLNWSDIKNILKMKHNIGCHGYTHKRLKKDLTVNQLKFEIIQSKKNIEKKIKKKILSFSWIGGERYSYSKKAYLLIKENYKISFMTACQPFSNNCDEQYSIHRFNIEDDYEINLIKMILSLYPFFYFLKKKYIEKIIF
jgi:peptidoglycan/xylan/chitin deacetylase (PgdA/CDA1 family)